MKIIRKRVKYFLLITTHMKGYYYLASQFIAKRKIRFVVLSLSIIVATASLFVLLALHFGVKQFLASKAFDSIGVKEIIVQPQFQSGLLLINKEEKRKITDTTVRNIEDMPGVEKVYPTIILKLPTSIRLTALGNTFESDAPIFGVAPEMVTSDLKYPSLFRADASQVGVVLSKDIIDFYNAGFSDSLGLPKLNDTYLLNAEYSKEVTLMLGYSSFLGSKDSGTRQDVPARIVGFSSRVPFLGISLPLEKVKEYSTQFGVGEGKINSLFVTVTDPSEVEEVSKKIEALGYATDSLQKRIDGINENLKLLSLIIGAISVIILLATAIALCNAFLSDVMENTSTIGILRSVGATRGFIGKLFLTKAVLISFFGGVVGTLFGFGIVQIVNRMLLEKLPFYLNAQASFSATPWYLIVFTIIFAVFFGIAATIYPAWYAARLDPAEALRR